eukprot:NODE_3115_length_939_cov_54.834975_g3094_i0.p1 GENE.NODE_3115_length_939_cov_54.834975_g3094_i0~~NODE_3115_length_939_cov_54.834975_g3094_i0.p1  ORF type:complete len:224 (+),score=54.85 NODE_3115_length_939_cov_54.834975_g3094_i0:216-887(+)
MQNKISDSRHMNWKDDKARTDCFHCKAKFGLLNRKHHCRSCGDIYCGSCWGKKINMPAQYGFADPQPVCMSCLMLFDIPELVGEGSAGGVPVFVERERKNTTLKGFFGTVKDSMKQPGKEHAVLFHWQPLSLDTQLRLNDEHIRMGDVKGVQVTPEGIQIMMQNGEKRCLYACDPDLGPDEMRLSKPRTTQLGEMLTRVVADCAKHGEGKALLPNAHRYEKPS